jgi:hypothetical protein
VFSPGANQLAVATNGTGRLFVDATGLVGIGTSAPIAKLDIAGGTTITTFADWNTKANTVFKLANPAVRLGIGYNSSDQVLIQAFDSSNASRSLALQPYGGNVGIGTTSPATTLDVISASAQLHAGPSSGHGLNVSCTDITFGRSANIDNSGFGAGINLYVGNNGELAGAHISTTGVHSISSTRSATPFDFRSAGDITLSSANVERARIDSSGRLLVGTSTSRGNNFSSSGQDFQFQIEGTDYLKSGASFTSNSAIATYGPHVVFNRSRGTVIGSNTVVQNGDNIGSIGFQGNDGSAFVQSATIQAFVDGTPSALMTCQAA